MAILEIALTLFVSLSLLSILVYAPFWILGGPSVKRRRPAERSVRAWPLIAVLSLVAIVGIFIVCSDESDLAHGKSDCMVGGFLLGHDFFAVASVVSAIALWRATADTIRRGVRRYSIIVTAALLIATAYLAYWGFIGLRTWV